jgi:hypothetical protein
MEEEGEAADCVRGGRGGSLDSIYEVVATFKKTYKEVI